MTAPASQEPPVVPIRIVDLFAGPGGLDVAAQKLGGVEVLTGIEWDADACKTRTAAGLPTTAGDVRRFGPEDFSTASVLAGGPPCQTYTVAGGGAGRRALDEVIILAKRMAAREDVSEQINHLDDERTGLVLEPLRWALAAIDSGRPYDAIVLEQVQTVLPVWEVVAEALRGEHYSVVCKVLRTEEYGVPQTRRRAILIARYQGKEPGNEIRAKLPKPTHHSYRKGAPRPTEEHGLKPWVAMNDVLKRSKSFVVVSNYGTGGDPKARGRRTSAEPCATVTGKISRNRIVAADGTESRFSDAEAGQLQTFPADYPWDGRDVSQQIGNAIPPRLAAHVLAAALDLGKETLDRAIASLETWAVRPDPEVRPDHVPAPAGLQPDLVSSRP